MKLLRESLARRKRGETGFSFIELVIVVAVVGILTSIAIPAYGVIQSNARQAAVATNVANGLKAAEVAAIGGDGTPTEAVEKLSDAQAIVLSLRPGATTDSFCVQGYDVRSPLPTGEGYQYTATAGSCAPEGESPGAPPPGEPEQPIFEPVAVYSTDFEAARATWDYQEDRGGWLSAFASRTLGSGYERSNGSLLTIANGSVTQLELRNLVPGAQYRIAGWVSKYTASSTHFRGVLPGSTTETPIAVPNSGWGSFALTWTSTSSTERVGFKTAAGANERYRFDNILVERVG